MPESQDDQPILRSNPAQHLADAESSGRAKPLYPGLPSGTGLGKYRILERIRTYHNAVVYKARDAMLDRLVAVKQMSPELIDRPIACGNFKREAQLLARIPKDARNIINIHELIEDEIGLFIVEEFVAGHWLESLLFKRQVDHRHAFKLLKTAAWGLKTLHSNSIVHRDVQPGNIMVTKNGSAKIANLASAAHEGDLSAPPVITPKYAAPELLLERRYDDRVDIYGLGFAIYEVCAGRLAMDRHFAEIIGDGIGAVGRWIDWHTNLDARLPDVTALNPLVPPALAAILRQMTAKNLDERYTSIDQVVDAVSRFFTPPDEPRRADFLHTPIRLPDVTPTSWKADHLLPTPPPAYADAEAFRPPTTSAPRLTRTQSVESTGRGPEVVDRWEWNAGRDPDTWSRRGPVRFSPQRRRRRAADSAPPRTAQIAAIPVPPPVVRTFKKHPWRVARWGFVFLTMLLLTSAGVFAVFFGGRLTGPHPLETLMREGVASYDGGQMEVAKSKFLKAKDLTVTEKDLQVLQNQSDFWLEMIAAQKALALNQFEEVQRLLHKAERRGVNPARVESLQQLAWSRQDAARLAETGMANIASGNLPAVEVELEEYEKKATAAGMDPNQLKVNLEQAKKDRAYSESIKLAMKALEKDDYASALTACGDAEGIRITTATRELRKRIIDSKQRKDLIARADLAMAERDFVAAESAYVQANQIFASPEIEQKSRAARSFILIEEARQAIQQGNLLMAEQKLKSSLWNSYTAEGKSLFDGMSPAFDAARIVRRGDRALERGEFDEATRLYEEAIPRLPSPANDAAKQKIVEVQRARLIKAGDEALKRKDRDKALEAYEAAKRIRDDDMIQQRMEYARSPFATTTRPMFNEPIQSEDPSEQMPPSNPLSPDGP